MSFFGVADHFIVSSRGVSFSQAWFYAQTGKSIAEQRFFWHGRRSYEVARYWDKFAGFARSLQRLYYVQCMIGEIGSQSRRTAADECVRHIADTDAAAVLFIGKLNRELSPGTVIASPKENLARKIAWWYGNQRPLRPIDFNSGIKPGARYVE